MLFLTLIRIYVIFKSGIILFVQSIHRFVWILTNKQLVRFKDLRSKETPRANYWSFGYRGVYYNRRVEI